MTDETTEKERETIERDDNEERCAQRTGIIAGDDWYVSPAHLHYGVFKAVNEFIEEWHTSSRMPMNAISSGRSGKAPERILSFYGLPGQA